MYGFLFVFFNQYTEYELRISDWSSDGCSSDLIGFTKDNRDSFDTLYTEKKITDGGKGFGRFTCLKYFDRVKVSSTFEDGGEYHDRSFGMGLGTDIIVDEEVAPSQEQKSGSVVEISGIKSVRFPDKRLDIISRVVVERLLPYLDRKSTRLNSSH